MFLTVHIPEACLAERRYVVSLIFEEFLGIPVRIAVERRADVAIVGADGKALILADKFFAAADVHWLQPESLPARPIRWTSLPENVATMGIIDGRLPVLFGEFDSESAVVCEAPNELRCSLDILGTVFFLISRYEEMVTQAADEHGRFPAQASLAHHAGFLDRPVADEYVELLWALLSQQWPGLSRKRNHYRLFLSHDVDTPFRVLGRNPLRVMAAAGADVALRRSVPSAAERLSNAYRVYRGNHAADSYNTFAYIMERSEAHSIRSAFYFITRRRRGRLDGTYQFNSQPIERLLQSIHDRGHEIGLHPGYTTFRSPRDIAAEFTLLRQQCDRLGIQQSEWGGRQHYLRWENPVTWTAWEAAGLDYDSTLGFSSDVGFRSGTCREYPVYDLSQRRPLGLRERPLIVMECALSYKLPRPAADCFDRVARLVNRCRQVNGNFTLLWHNSNLVTDAQRRCYEEILQMAA